MRSPATVGTMPAPERTSQGSPASSRRRLSAALTAGWYMPSFRAARETLRSVSTMCSTRMRCRSILSNMEAYFIRGSHMAKWAIRHWRHMAEHMPCQGPGAMLARMKPQNSGQTLRFLHRGQAVTLANVAPERTLLDLLREDLHLSATKEGCGEGDCGACTVVLGEEVSGQLRYKAINSCIRLAHSVDGMALWTAADLAAPTGDLHPAQEALVRCHGSQCGFCTPGFVMSLFGMYQNTRGGQGITRERAQADLSGNL